MSDQATTTAPGGESKQTLEQHAAHLRAAFVRAITRDDLAAISRKLTEQAREGDRTSARLLLKYGLGDATLAQTDCTLHWEKKDAAAAARRGEPTAEQVMATIHAKAQQQQALQADILRMGGVGPKPANDRHPGSGAPGKGTPPANAGR